MKKILISAAVALATFGIAGAQQATTTDQMPPVLPPAITTGSSTLDAQIKVLRIEMEAKIKAIREEYQTKLKAIVGERRAVVASTTKQIRADVKEVRKDARAEVKEVRANAKAEIRGTSTEGQPQGNAWGFFRKFFAPKPPVNGTTSPVTQ